MLHVCCLVYVQFMVSMKVVCHVQFEMFSTGSVQCQIMHSVQMCGMWNWGVLISDFEPPSSFSCPNCITVFLDFYFLSVAYVFVYLYL